MRTLERCLCALRPNKRVRQGWQEVAWPGGGKEPKSADQLFELLADWDARNYVVCAATKEGTCEGCCAECR